MCETGTQKVKVSLKKAIEAKELYEDMKILDEDQKILDWINEPVEERLIRFLEEKLGNDLKHQTKEEKLKFWKQELQAMAKEKGVEIDKNALSRWFPTGAQYTVDPTKGGEQTRYNIYCLAYVLDLFFNEADKSGKIEEIKKDEIREFFNKIFRMLPYDLKNKQELIWWYYLRKHDYLWYPKGVAFYKILQRHKLLSTEDIQNLLAEYYFAKKDSDWYSDSMAMYNELLELAKEPQKKKLPKSIPMESLQGLIDKYVSSQNHVELDGQTLFNELMELQHKPMYSGQLDNLDVERLNDYYTEDVELSLESKDPNKKDKLITEDQLASFIILNWDILDHEHEMWTAKTNLKILAEQAQFLANEECIHHPERNKTRKDVNSNRDTESTSTRYPVASNHLLSTITGVNKRTEEPNDKFDIFPSYYDLDKVIKNGKGSAGTLRKLTIMLFFYTYVSSSVFKIGVKYNKKYTYSTDDFLEQMDDQLEQWGFPALYHYNEFDLLFIYCAEKYSSQKLDEKYNPVTELRAIIQKMCFEEAI